LFWPAFMDVFYKEYARKNTMVALGWL